MSKNITYVFSDTELSQLTLYFRKNSASLPASLKDLSEFAENYVYGKMTIEEAESFFSADISK